MNSNFIRQEFPQLKGDRMHYLDSAASSLTPVSVISAVDEYYFDYRANVHRGVFKEAVRATEAYEQARRTIAEYLHASHPSEVIFTAGATDASNMLVRMLEEGGKFKSGDNIVSTVMEHHSAILPLTMLAQRQHLEVRLGKIKGVQLDLEHTLSLIDEHTRVVSVMLASHVTGTVNDIAALSVAAHRVGALMIVDATAAMGHISVDVAQLGIDALYFSGHKMFAPTGVGVLWVKQNVLQSLPPVYFGGHMVARVGETVDFAPIPERFEAGTKDVGGVIGLGRAILFLKDLDVSLIQAHTSMLAGQLIHGLDTITGVTVFAERDPSRTTGVVGFSCDFAHPHDIAEVLARHNVAIRPGHHCAIPLHTQLGVPGTNRASFHIYNDARDIEALITSLKEARALFAA
jgi:cysteine desulfurase / selenocysteine lyase